MEEQDGTESWRFIGGTKHGRHEMGTCLPNRSQTLNQDMVTTGSQKDKVGQGHM